MFNFVLLYDIHLQGLAPLHSLFVYQLASLLAKESDHWLAKMTKFRWRIKYSVKLQTLALLRQIVKFSGGVYKCYYPVCVVQVKTSCIMHSVDQRIQCLTYSLPYVSTLLYIYMEFFKVKLYTNIWQMTYFFLWVPGKRYWME